MDTLVVFGAKYLIYVVVLGGAAAVALWGRGRRDIYLTLAVALPLVYALARLVGMLYSHQQPFAAEGFEPLVPHAVDNSFPSDHTAIAGVFATVALVLKRNVGLVLWVLALLVGVSRMAAGLHYGVDIVAATLLGAGVTWLVYSTIRTKLY